MSVRCAKTIVRAAAAVLSVIAVALVPCSAQLADEHSADAIRSALHSPIPPAVLEKARQLDDQLLSAGRSPEGANIDLVTDHRLDRAQAIINRLLRAIGQNPDAWIVRVLDTNPPTINAFVLGGRYVYIYAGLMDFVSNDDELAFILAHEIGHSLLQHRYRKSQDVTTAVADIAILIGEIWKRNRQAFYAGALGVSASYSRLDEEEADALGAAIAYRAGFDPLRGAGFFSRMKQEGDEHELSERQQLAQSRTQIQQLGARCNADAQLYQYPQYRTAANYQIITTECQNYAVLAARYNQSVQTFNAQLQRQSLAPIFSDHPSYAERTGAVAAVADYLAGRRSLESLADHQQSYRVMGAIAQPPAN